MINKIINLFKKKCEHQHLIEQEPYNHNVNNNNIVTKCASCKKIIVL